MQTPTAADVVMKYQPLIIHECRKVWRAALSSGQVLPCELPDLIQAARVQVLVEWSECRYKSTPVMFLRRVSHNAAVDCLRERFAPPIDLTQFCDYAA